ncbi:PDZ domain-containing protein, partial [Candidatus Parcubacteria bacterium]
RTTLPAVVSIVISKQLRDVAHDLPHDLDIIPPFLRKQEKKARLEAIHRAADAKGMVEVGGGSGFFVDPTGLILTNKHVISDPKARYTVLNYQGEPLETTVLSRDPINDIAILKVHTHGKKKRFPVVPLGNSSTLKLGQFVLTFGNVLGVFRNTVSLGIISGLSRSITAQASSSSPPQELRGLIQTDAAVNPGNSGGPLIDMKGKAVGINAAIASGAESVGFAIPINPVKRDLADIKRYGRIKRPFLGVRYIMLTKDLQKKIGAPVSNGAVVVRETIHDHAVAPGSPAAEAGIREGDIILSCNGHSLSSSFSLQDALESCKVGDVISLEVLRGKKLLTLRVMLAERT